MLTRLRKKEREKSHKMVIFKVAENLMNLEYPTIICPKGFEEQFELDKGRTLEGYCFEFCGKFDIKIKALRWILYL
jgi:hypothetical protein